YPNQPDTVTILDYFRYEGYQVAGAGKIFHHTAGNHPPNQWHAFQRLIFRDDPWFRGVKLNYPWSSPAPNPKGFPFSGVNGLGHENDWGSLEIPEALYDDASSVDFAVDFLKADHARPFFLACGLFRPHLPWYVPKSYFDLYPLEEVVVPEVKPEDLNDVPAEGRQFAKARRSDLKNIQDAGRHREAVRAYLASISFADAQLGRVLDGLAESRYAETTVVVFWSDHGWHLGEKNHWHKTTLWEEATRVPFIITAPGYSPGVCRRAVSLIELYPTLVDLCGLTVPKGLDGLSLKSLLNNPDGEWHRPAVTEFKKGNAAVRTDRYRYIRYRNGGEELYDHRNDPKERTNLATRSHHAEIKKKLAEHLPLGWADSASTKSAFTFDPETFTWTHRKSGEVISGARKGSEPR
ncbi:MAG: sulfatase, partial [Verrucomicrobiota bacterium]